MIMQLALMYKCVPDRVNNLRPPLAIPCKLLPQDLRRERCV